MEVIIMAAIMEVIITGGITSDAIIIGVTMAITGVITAITDVTTVTTDAIMAITGVTTAIIKD